MSARAQAGRLAATQTRAAEPRGTFLISTRQALRGLTRSGLFWGVGLALYPVMLVAIFPSLKGAVDVSTYPQGLRDALGITDMSHIRPFLQVEFISYLPLVLAFYPMTVLAGTIAGAEERRWLDVLLGNPVSRRTVVLGAMAALAVVPFAILVGDAVVMWIFARLLDIDLSLSASLQGMLANWPIGLAFGAVALAVSATVRSRAAALGIAAAVMFGFYLLNLLATLVSGVAWLKWLSAFHYYGSPMTEGLFWGGAVVLLIAAGVLTAVAVAAFERRDIYT
jgi:ABC-2 type transport system permease protein